ncbi:MAG: hypothetical protein K2N44_10700 [Lachnospiraceae bacterium]|nr:hypothetical protein [Lachnospiraceae bacterium]
MVSVKRLAASKIRSSNTLIDNILPADQKSTKEEWNSTGIVELVRRVRAMGKNDLNEWIVWFSNVVRELGGGERKNHWKQWFFLFAQCTDIQFSTMPSMTIKQDWFIIWLTVRNYSQIASGGKRMQEEKYKIAGTVKIPEDKKAEFNNYVMQILDKCGIRKTESAELAGKRVLMVDKPVVDKRGVVRFDYSIFEKKKRKIATYSLNTCELTTPDRGYNEFGVVMNMIMVMQEAYSEEQCCLMYGDEPCYIGGYAVLIRTVLGIELNFPHRARMWDMLLFLKNTEEYKNITGEKLWDTCPFGFCDFLKEQMITTLAIDEKEVGIPKKLFGGNKSDIEGASWDVCRYYVYQMTEQLIESGENNRLELFLKELLEADLAKRQELASADGVYGMMAKISLYHLPAILIQAYAFAVGKEFWEVWNTLGIRGYTDIMMDLKKKKVSDGSGGQQRQIMFYKVIQRESEDEFIEFWDETDLDFSEEMKESLLDWRERFEVLEVPEYFNTEQFLAEIVMDLDQDWGCRLVDKAFITEFMEYKDDHAHRKALCLYRELMDEDTAYFPELTHKQAICWVIKANRDKFDFVALSAFQSLLINHRHRFEVLGF